MLTKLKISETEKFQKDGEWFKDYMNKIVPFNFPTNDDYQIMRACYQAVNNDLTYFKDRLKDFCDPMGFDIGDITPQIEAYPELRNKLLILKGEMLSRREQLNLLLLSEDALVEKNKSLREAIMQSIDEKIALMLQADQMLLEGKSPEDVQKFLQEERTQYEPENLATMDYKSESEIFFNHLLQYCLSVNNIQDLKSQTIEDVIIADRCFIYVGWKHGKPYFEIRNPLMVGFHKAPNKRYIQNSDWVWYTKTITPAEAMEYYDLSDEQCSELGISINKGLSKRFDVMGGTAEATWDHTPHNMLLAQNKGVMQDKTLGLSQAPLSTPYVTQLIYETHFEFKAFKQIIMLSHSDEYGQQIVVPVSTDFEIPKSAKKEKFTNRFDQKAERYVWYDKDVDTEFTAEFIWIPRRYEIVRLGSSVYPIMREVPYQPINVEDPFSTFELSTKGAIFNSRNAKSVSLVQHALPPYFQYLYIKKIQNDELAKYQGAIQAIDVDQIPDSLGKDLFGNDIRDKVVTYLTFLKKTNKDLYSGSQSSLGGLPPATRSPGSSGYMLGTAVELLNLQQLLDLLKREISMAMGISPQREASFIPGSNVTDNQQAITQSYAITEPLFYTHAQIWKAAINDWLINFAQYCRLQFEVHNLKELSLNYWLPNNTQQILKITPESFTHTDIGLVLTNSASAEKYSELMLQNLQAFAQNGGEGVSAISRIIMDIVSGASPQEVHKAIQIEEQRNHERQAQLQQMQQEAQMKMQQAELENREDQQAALLEQIRVKAIEDRITKLEVAGIQATALGLQSDNNDNGIPDSVDLAKLALENEKLNLQEREFKHKQEVDKEKLIIDRKKANKPSGK